MKPWCDPRRFRPQRGVAAAVGAVLLGLALLAGLAALAAPVLASGQPPGALERFEFPSVATPTAITVTIAYTVTDLGSYFNPLAVNDHGQVLGYMYPNEVLWLPEPAYGLPAGLNDLGFLSPAYWNSIWGINNDGIMTGYIWDPDFDCSDEERPATWTWNEPTQQWITTLLATSGEWDTAVAMAINNAGTVVGEIMDECTDEEEGLGRQAARWQNGLMTALGTLGGDRSNATAINNVGQIAGVSGISSGPENANHAFLWTNNIMMDLGTLPGDLESAATGINDEGQVIGSSDDRPFLWLPAPAYGLPAGMHNLAAFSDDPNPGQVYGLNNDGQIVGQVNFGEGHKAFLWDRGTAHDLNDLIDPEAGWDLIRATDINENGEIVGFGILDGQTRAFLLKPQKRWTVMLYLDGDNDLASTYPPIFNRLEAAADNPNVSVLVYWDNNVNGDSAYYEVQYDVDLNNYASYTVDENAWPQGELDSSAPFTLSDFATWAMENYPADHYALFLSNHGSGLAGGLIEETPAPSSIMNLPEMQLALATIHEETGEKIDVLYMDMCLMGMIEDAYQFREHIDYYVSSEYLQWAFDEPYTDYLAGIGPYSKPAEVATLFAGAYAGVAAPSGNAYTIAAAEIAALDAEMDAISGTLGTIDQLVQRFDNEPPNGVTITDTYVDLYDFADLASGMMSGYPAIVAAAEGVKVGVDNYVIYESHASSPTVNLDNSHGVSIFFPAMASSFYSPDNYDFAVGANWTTGGGAPALPEGSGSWGGMLVSYFAATQPGGPDDPTPPEPLPRLIPGPGLRQLFLPMTVRR